MKRFEKRELRQAIAHAIEGGQALHVHNVIANWKRAPVCFKRAVRRGEMIAHLFDQDYNRLVKLAKKFGVNRVRVERIGQSGQHIDLCGTPLTRAEFYCEDEATYSTMFE